MNAGGVLSDMGRFEEALRAPEHARVIYERLARENPSVTEFKSRLAMCFNNIGNEYYHLGQAAEALASLEQSCDIEDRLRAQTPRPPTSRANWQRVTTTSASCSMGRASRPRHWPRSSGRARSRKS